MIADMYKRTKFQQMMTLKARKVLGWMSERSGTGVKDNISSLYYHSMYSLNFHS